MARRFNPEMNGGLQLGLDLFGDAAPEPAPVAVPARELPNLVPAAAEPEPGPTTVVCIKGRQGDPDIADVLYVGRPMYQAGWRLHGHTLSNPYKVGKHGTSEQVVERYREWLLRRPDLVHQLLQLRGKRLGCWCPEGAPCHARVLAEMADSVVDV